MTTSFQSGTTEINGARVDRILIASTRHMPDLGEDLTPWHWGECEPFGMVFLWAYEEDPCVFERPIPGWLLQLCVVARQRHGCNWILLDPEGEVVPELPVYEHS
jgi:hypothetical protein